MRIYSNMKDAMKETERELVEMGSFVHPETMQDKQVKDDKNFDTLELQGYSYCITNPNSVEQDVSELGVNVSYALAELVDRLNPRWTNPGTSYLKREEVWNEFLHDDKFAYTYNERIREQLEWIILEMRKRPSTRQAVLTIYDRHQDMSHMGGQSRVPCSMYYQFLIRQRSGKNYVDCIYTMRSCDYYTHLFYDVYFAVGLQKYVAASLQLEAGNFTHFIGSLHAYSKDYSKRRIF